MVDKPAFNEYPVWSKNSQGRGGKKPTVFLLHTNEGDSNADQLARWMQGSVGVSYHYTINQAVDGGVTVCDVVDTDLASWSVGNANSISINLCFAGSKAAWTRDQWLKQSKSIDVAAYLAVQDCRKYGMSTLVIPPPYKAGTPGISDHRWVTDIYGWGTHIDVGPGFPWDVFSAAVAKYTAAAAPDPTTPTTPEVPMPNATPESTDQRILDMHRQILGRWEMLGWLTVVEALALLVDAATGSKNAGKTGWKSL